MRQQYGNGAVGIILDDKDCGFCYYESGRVAVCSSKVNDWQQRYFVYADHIKKTLLCSLDEHVTGSAGQTGETKLVLTRDGGLISDENGNFIKTWRWDANKQNAGTPPTEAIVLHLNEYLTFTFTDRKNVSIKFSHHGLSHEFDCGEKKRRTDTYLDTATRVAGKLVVQTEKLSLIDRHRISAQENVSSRNKQKPKSGDFLSPEIRKVVATLESNFDTYGGHHVRSSPEAGWKEAAREATLSEVPLCRPSGSEVGTKPTRFGQTVDYDVNAKLALNSTVQLKSKEQEWLGSVEIRNMLQSQHPVLPRSAALSNASGRYSIDAKVPGSPVAQGTRLNRVSATSLQTYLNDCPAEQVVLVACLREDDRVCRTLEKVLELMNDKIQNGILGANMDETQAAAACHSNQYEPLSQNQFRIIKVEMSESRKMVLQYNVKALPTFLLFYNAKLVTTTSMGGLPIRVTPSTKNASLVPHMNYLPSVLLIEPSARKQISCEKVLKKEKFQWDLALNITDAVAHGFRKSQVSEQSGASRCYGLLLASDSIPSEEALSLHRCIKSGGETTVVVVILTTITLPFSPHMCAACYASTGKRTSVHRSVPRKGEICPHCGIITEGVALSSPPFSTLAQVAVYKQIKAATLHRLAEMWHRQSSNKKARSLDKSHKGMTCDAVLKVLQDAFSAGQRGRFGRTNDDIMLSTMETNWNGTPLNTISN